MMEKINLSGMTTQETTSAELRRHFNRCRWVLQRLVEHEEYMVKLRKRPEFGCSELQQARAFIEEFGEIDPDRDDF